MAKKTPMKRTPAAAESRARVASSEVFNPLPAGSRDLLPDTFRVRRAVTGGLLDCFERWGFDPVGTPAVEYFDVFRRGLGEREQERCVRFIEAGSGALVTLRSDVTPQIARIVAQRMDGRLGGGQTVRLCYAADVVRLPDRRHERAEFHQAGVELVGDGHATSDAELISLCHEALRGVGLDRMGIDLAHTAIVREALARLNVTAREGQRLRAYLGRKDRGGLDQALAGAGIKGRSRTALVRLCELHGAPGILDQARTSLRALRIDAAIDRLQEVLDVLARDDPDALASVTLDLGEVRGFDYYTGLRMRVWAPGVSEPIARGGRYNDLLSRYGLDLPATGFAVDLDALEAALLHADADVVGSNRAAGRLVVVDPACDDAETRTQALAEARAARARGLRSWVEVGLAREDAKRAAADAGADKLSYFTRASRRSQAVTRERWRRGARSWREDSSGRKRSR